MGAWAPQQQLAAASSSQQQQPARQQQQHRSQPAAAAAAAASFGGWQQRLRAYRCSLSHYDTLVLYRRPQAAATRGHDGHAEPGHI
eukprot:COSAG01_NODE_8025_length_2950_cov_1.257454_3_plen_86_part_00